jgi:hypothetical protein
MKNIIFEGKEVDPQELIKMHKEGISIAKIARKFHTSQKRIREFFKELNYDYISKSTRFKYITNIEELVNLHKSGISLGKLSKQFNYSILNIISKFKEIGYDYTKKIGFKKIFNIKELINLHKQGMNIKKIAKHFNYKYNNILVNFKEVGYNYLKIRTISKSDIKKIIFLHKQGTPLYKLVKKFNHHNTKIVAAFKENNYNHINREKSINIYELIKLHKQNISVKELSEKFHCSIAEVYKSFKRGNYIPKTILYNNIVNGEELVELHKKGVTIAQLCKKFYYARINILKKFKELEYNHLDFSIPIFKLVDLHKKGHRIIDLCKKYHVDSTTIVKKFNEVGYDYIANCPGKLPEEIRKCACGCGKTFKSRITLKKKYFSTECFLKDFSKKTHKGMNKTEELILKLLNSLFPQEYKFVGNFQVFFGGKCPDFININGKKKIIEYFGQYWHREDNPQNRINHFKKYGYDTYIILEKELKNIEELSHHLEQFHKGVKNG